MCRQSGLLSWLRDRWQMESPPFALSSCLHSNCTASQLWIMWGPERDGSGGKDAFYQARRWLKFELPCATGWTERERADFLKLSSDPPKCTTALSQVHTHMRKGKRVCVCMCVRAHTPPDFPLGVTGLLRSVFFCSLNHPMLCTRVIAMPCVEVVTSFWACMVWWNTSFIIL